VVFSQNHDQVGNRMSGDRLAENLPIGKLKLAVAMVLLSPYLPLLFMGEEYGETAPFQYFTSHSDPALAESIKEGRRKAFLQKFHWQGEVPDPQSEETFNHSKINPELRRSGQHGELFEFYRTLINIRKQHPAIHAADRERIEVTEYPQQKAIVVLSQHDEEQMFFAASFNDSPVTIKTAVQGTWRKILDSSSGENSGGNADFSGMIDGEIHLNPYCFNLYKAKYHMNRFLCIHGHFYQPPRENPWLEEVEIQDSAYPYHDWNRRITAECYSNNTASRILDEEMRITDIVSNYAKISFDMGPTLLQWLQKNSPKTYNAIIEADKLSLKWRSGHGAAMAQAYNHMIMPLASERDKKTQILWGIGDFKHRFGRDPEGMWLPETAVDLATLDLLASLGISYTVLAPHQVHRIRKKGAREWEDVSDAKIDPKVPYICNLPSGRKITLFFYDGPISRAVAFERLLDSGEQFAKRLLEGFSDENGGTQLMHMATDGESYGHHHRFGDMALSYTLDHIESSGLARITNYGEFLEASPPAPRGQPSGIRSGDI
jgi:hypothetical protein